MSLRLPYLVRLPCADAISLSDTQLPIVTSRECTTARLHVQSRQSGGQNDKTWHVVGSCQPRAASQTTLERSRAQTDAIRVQHQPRSNHATHLQPKMTA